MQDITNRFERWGGLVVSALIEPEVVSALARYAREHPKRPPDALDRHPAVVDAFRTDLSESAFTVVGVTNEVVKQATELLRLHPEYAIHAGDAVHLATALAVRALRTFKGVLVFVTADRGLEAAAKAEGLATFNPLVEDLGKLRGIPGIAPS